jgi:RNA polymerase sigma factor (TIGR02999 family)
MTEPRGEITLLLRSLSGAREPGREATDRLFELVYAEMRTMASRLMSRERAGHTLAATALVHEAYLKLVDQTNVHWEDRSHFLRVACTAMRRILVDYARALATDKRGGAWQRVTLDDPAQAAGAAEIEVIALDQALVRLGQLDTRMEHVVSMRAFGGLGIPEIARLLDVSERTVYADWEMARRWLDRELAGG